MKWEIRYEADGEVFNDYYTKESALKVLKEIRKENPGEQFGLYKLTEVSTKLDV